MTCRRFSLAAFATLLLLLSSTFANVSYAADYCGDATTRLNAGDDPGPYGLVCPVIRVFNFFLLAVGAALVVTIIYGAIKVSMSLGDPKGLAGAKNTWTFAVVGAAIILFSFVIYIVLCAAIGITPWQPSEMVNKLQEGLAGFIGAAGITGQ